MLCTDLHTLTGNYSRCADQISSVCDEVTLTNCPCIVINPAASLNASNAVRKLDEWEVKQAWVQLSLSALSLLLGGSFLACYAICMALVLSIWRHANTYHSDTPKRVHRRGFGRAYAPAHTH